jgi:hypothetical protein
MDEAFKTICGLISLDLFFHISSYKTTNESWTTLEGIFGKWDDMRGNAQGISHIGSKKLRKYPRFLYKIQGFTIAIQILRGLFDQFVIDAHGFVIDSNGLID